MGMLCSCPVANESELLTLAHNAAVSQPRFASATSHTMLDQNHTAIDAA
jgi:hypothetical protein